MSHDAEHPRVHKEPYFQDGCVLATIDTRTYRLTAIQKAAYRLAVRCTVVIGSDVGDCVDIRLLFPRSISEPDALEIARLYFQELLDQELREKVAEETSAIRALVLANAYSKTSLIRRE